MLREKGVTVTDAVVYENVPASEDDDELLKLIEEGGIHVVTFTSSSTVKNLVAALKGMGLADPVQALSGATIACIGPLTAQTARDVGFKVDIMAEESTINSLVQSLCDWRASQRD
ncbi:uroporphyrinogen-III synthase [compost metagenome]